MQLRAALGAASGTGLLPVFGYALLAALVLGAIGGGWFGMRWMKGANAIAENAQLRLEANAWAGIASEQRQINTDNATAFKAAAERMGAIAQEREDDRESLRQWKAELDSSLEQLRSERPDLELLELGPEFLRHWNKANAGPAAAAPASKPGSEPAPTVPAASGSDLLQSPAGAGAARHGSEPLSRLQQQDRAADPGQRRMAGHRLAVVLHGGQAHRHRSGRMPS